MSSSPALDGSVSTNREAIWSVHLQQSINLCLAPFARSATLFPSSHPLVSAVNAVNAGEPGDIVGALRDFLMANGTLEEIARGDSSGMFLGFLENLLGKIGDDVANSSSGSFSPYLLDVDKSCDLSPSCLSSIQSLPLEKHPWIEVSLVLSFRPSLRVPFVSFPTSRLKTEKPKLTIPCYQCICSYPSGERAPREDPTAAGGGGDESEGENGVGSR